MQEENELMPIPERMTDTEILWAFVTSIQIHALKESAKTPAVLHDGSCSSRRAICRSRHHHGSGANNRRLHPTDVCWPHVRQAAFDQRSVLHRRNSKDRLRPSALSAIRAIQPPEEEFQ
jgi:hypothetical protein